MRVLTSVRLVSAALVIGCGRALPTGVDNPQSNIRMSILLGRNFSDTVVVLAPDSVRAHQIFNTSFLTLAGGCEADYGMLTTATLDTITFTPLSRHSQQPCPMTAEGASPRSVAGSFDTPGLKTLRVAGFILSPNGALSPTVIHKDIQVTP